MKQESVSAFTYLVHIKSRNLYRKLGCLKRGVRVGIGKEEKEKRKKMGQR